MTQENESSENSKRPNIMSYGDYRQYLKDLFWYLKGTTNHFSYEYCARKIDVSRAYFKQVFDHRSHIHLNKASAVAEMFKLSKFESECFMIMLIADQVDDEKLKDYFGKLLSTIKYYAKIPELKNWRDGAQDVGGEQPDWLSSTIVELAKYEDFKFEPAWIQTKLCSTIEISTIQKAMDFLIEKKIMIQENGVIKPTEVLLAPSLMDRHHYKQFLSGADKISELLHSDYEEYQRHLPTFFTDGSIAVNEESYKKLTAAFDSLNRSIMEINADTKPAKEVFFVSFSLFKIAKS